MWQYRASGMTGKEHHEQLMISVPSWPAAGNSSVMSTSCDQSDGVPDLACANVWCRPT